MFRIAIALTVLLWGAFAYADDEAVIAVGKAAVAAKLIDPDSVHFTDVHAITRNGRQFVCGHVAAKTLSRYVQRWRRVDCGSLLLIAPTFLII
jgi:hypothetical protein